MKFEKKFDVILNMEVVEHVANVDLFIENAYNIVEKYKKNRISYDTSCFLDEYLFGNYLSKVKYS